MLTNSYSIDTELLQKEMEQRMGTIYEELRRLFFSHGHRKLPRFESFDIPKIELSDVIKTKSLGKYSIGQAMEMIESITEQISADDSGESGWLKDAVDCLKRIIRNYKCGEFEKKSDFDGLLRELLDILDEVKTEGGTDFNNDGYKKIIEAIDILKNVEKEVIILGEFSSEENRITLYTKANDRCKRNSTLRNRMLATLAHELFHAMHCSVKGKDKWNNKPGDAREKVDARKTVVESLARWAEYCWCKHQDEVDFKYLADEMKKEWETSDFPSDHYAGAKVFDNEGVIDLDIEVLDASIKDWDKAYTMMESHRNGKVLKYSIDDEAKKLFGKLIRKISIHELVTKDWAIIHPHDLKMNEWYNKISCKLVQYELEQSGYEVMRIPCKGLYLKRNKEYAWGISALFFIMNNENEIDRSRFFIDSIMLIAKKHINAAVPFFGAVSSRYNTNEVHFITQGNDEGSVKTLVKPYNNFDKDSIQTNFQDIFYRIGAIES